MTRCDSYRYPCAKTTPCHFSDQHNMKNPPLENGQPFAEEHLNLKMAAKFSSKSLVRQYEVPLGKSAHGVLKIQIYYQQLILFQFLAKIE